MVLIINCYNSLSFAIMDQENPEQTLENDLSNLKNTSTVPSEFKNGFENSLANIKKE